MQRLDRHRLAHLRCGAAVQRRRNPILQQMLHLGGVALLTPLLGDRHPTGQIDLVTRDIGVLQLLWVYLFVALQAGHRGVGALIPPDHLCTHAPDHLSRPRTPGVWSGGRFGGSHIDPDEARQKESHPCRYEEQRESLAHSRYPLHGVVSRTAVTLFGKERQIAGRQIIDQHCQDRDANPHYDFGEGGEVRGAGRT